MVNKLNNYALLVGVEDYGTYDRSVGQPAGTSDLPGAAADARALFRQCIVMGFSPERIRVLTTPKMAPADLGPEARDENVGDASHASIVAGLEWIAKAVGTDAPVSGLIAFSGHGMDEGGVVLCPSDTTGTLEQVIRVAAVNERIGTRKAKENLTVLLDTCHSQVRANQDRSLQARLGAAVKGFPQGAGAERVISACQRDQVSAFSLFGGEWRGAFTWAITSAMGQWKTTIDKGVARLDVSHGELVSRARALLAALSFKQVPVLSGGKIVETMAFLQPGMLGGEGKTSKEPNQTRAHGQLVPMKYAIYWNDQYLAAINASGGSESWWVDTTVAYQLQAAGQSGQLLMKVCADSDWPKIDNWSKGTAPLAIRWQTSQSPEYLGTSTFAGNYIYRDSHGNLTSGNLAIGFDFGDVDDRARTAMITMTYWYNPDTSGRNVDLTNNPGNQFEGRSPLATSRTYQNPATDNVCDFASSPLR